MMQHLQPSGLQRRRALCVELLRLDLSLLILLWLWRSCIEASCQGMLCCIMQAALHRWASTALLYAERLLMCMCRG